MKSPLGMKKSLAKQHVTYKTTCYLALILAKTPSYCLWHSWPTFPVLAGIYRYFWNHQAQLPISDEV